MNNRIKHRRNELNITQKQLADMLSISKSWMNKLETGKQIPTTSMAVRIANALNCKVEDIFYN